MGAIEFVIQLFAKPLGFIGVALFLVGLYYGLTGNIFGWLGTFGGIALAFISEKG
ncbi:MAG: hypothetical protein U0R44_00435 [Candidatus Micrarchaeia archaeon]